LGYNARNDEIRDNVTPMKGEFEDQRQSLATVRRFTGEVHVKNLEGSAITGACRRVSRVVYWITIALPGQRTLAHRRQLN
jgi:hypothetical protein